MSRADPKLVAKLKKYSKEQIIEALANQYNADYFISGVVNFVEEQQSNRLLKEHSEAIELYTTAQRAYSDFIREMAQKYGDGKTFKISALSPAEYAKGVSLEKIVKEAATRESELDKKVTKMLKLEE